MTPLLMTILIALNPDGSGYDVLAPPFPTTEACGVELQNYAPEDGWSFHCWDQPVRPLPNPKRSKG